MKPRIFIGSSVEGKPIAEAIAGNFTHDAYPTVWDQMVFLPSTYPLESLLKAVADHDFGILVLSPDDVLKIKGATAVVPRGNVLFEAALFIGKHGRDRCFLIQPRSHPAFTLPTDLEGIVPATYDENHYRINPSAAVGPACTSIRSAIKSSASFNRAVMVAPKLELADPATSSFTYPKKLALTVTNPSMSAVLVTSRHFEVGGRVNGHADRFRNVFRVEFFAYKDHSGTDIYQIECLLKTGTSARAWLALDSSTMMRPPVMRWRRTSWASGGSLVTGSLNRLNFGNTSLRSKRFCQYKANHSVEKDAADCALSPDALARR